MGRNRIGFSTWVIAHNLTPFYRIADTLSKIICHVVQRHSAWNRKGSGPCSLEAKIQRYLTRKGSAYGVYCNSLSVIRCLDLAEIPDFVYYECKLGGALRGVTSSAFVVILAIREILTDKTAPVLSSEPFLHYTDRDPLRLYLRRHRIHPKMGASATLI